MFRVDQLHHRTMAVRNPFVPDEALLAVVPQLVRHRIHDPVMATGLLVSADGDLVAAHLGGRRPAQKDLEDTKVEGSANPPNARKSGEMGVLD